MYNVHHRLAQYLPVGCRYDADKYKKKSKSDEIEYWSLFKTKSHIETSPNPKGQPAFPLDRWQLNYEGNGLLESYQGVVRQNLWLHICKDTSL